MKSLLIFPIAFGFSAASHAAPATPAATQQMVDRVLKETSAIRGLSIKRPVVSGVQSIKGVEAMVEGQLKTQTSANELRATEIFLTQLGLAPAGFGLKKYYVGMMGEQIAGYYESKTKKFYTSSNVDSGQLEMVMSHELTHALQDQHFDLSRLENWPKHDSDARMAMSALVEGDATFTMARYTTRNPFRALGVLASALRSPGDTKALSAGPRILRESLTFPYLQGMQFATKLYQGGGWPSVSRAFSALPQSTEQVLHFEKYQSREAPVKVELRDISSTLGAGWKLLDHDVNGEMGLALIVGEHLQDEPRATRAAAGWGGDRYSVYGGPKGNLVVQDCRFDTPADAAEWQQAYAKRTDNRLKKSAQVRGALQVWNAAPNGVWMEKRGSRVLILEGTVGVFNPNAVLNALWR
ncbi:MAG TPA: hypothetical protein VF627_03465 [Abditibacterium sp.]